MAYIVEEDACMCICLCTLYMWPYTDNIGFEICTGAKAQMLKVSLSQLCSCFDLLLYYQNT